MTRSPHRRTWVSWAGCVLFLVALVLRLGPAVGDLPHVYDYDEPLFMSFEVGQMYVERTLEPKGYAHPALYKDLSVATLSVVGSIAGWDGEDVTAISGLYGDRIVNNPMPWFTIRTLAALLGAAAVVLTWDAARRLGAPAWAAATAGAVGAFSPLLLSNAPRVAADGFSVFFAMLAVWCAVWASHRPSLQRQLLLGVSIGLVASAKYNGATFAVLALGPLMVATTSWTLRARWLVATAAIAALTFVAANPFAFVHFGVFLEESRAQSLVYSYFRTGSSGRSNLFNGRTLLDGAGPLAVLATLAIPAQVFRSSAPTREASRTRACSWELVATVAVTIGIAGWMVLQGRYYVREARNVMPLVLPVCVLGAVALGQVWGRVCRTRSVALSAAAVLVLFAWIGMQTSKGMFEFGRSVADERADARDWLNDHVEPGQTLVGEFGTPYLSHSDFDQREVGLLSELDIDEIRNGSVDWVVSSSEVTSGIFSDQARWADPIAFYEERYRGVCDWHVFRSWNTEIRVGRVCPLNERGVNAGLAGG